MTQLENIRYEWAVVGGLRVHYLAAGEAGSPVLLLHGGGLDAASLTYKYNVEPLAREHRVFAPDWPGYGESDSPRDEATIEYYIDCLGRLMEALGLGQASLAGLSLGGGIALGFALASPERVSKLVLVDSYGLGNEVPGGPFGAALVKLPLVNELTWQALAGSRAIVRWSLHSIVHDSAAITDDLVEEVYRLVRKPGVGRAWQSFQRSEAGWAGVRTSYVGRLAQLAVPTLILQGAEDTLVPVAWAKRAHALIPGSALEIVPDCGHWLPREKPEAFNRAVLAFLGE